MRKVDLIIHPARFRILRTLEGKSLTTQEISDRLADVPQSSVYRHLKLLLDGGIVEVKGTQLVKGIQEKTYCLSQPPVLEADDIATLSADEHVGFFTTYVLTLIHDFAEYVQKSEREEGTIDFLSDRVGYREVAFEATKKELDLALAAVNHVVMPLLKKGSKQGRRRYKLATIIHPLAGD